MVDIKREQAAPKKTRAEDADATASAPKGFLHWGPTCTSPALPFSSMSTCSTRFLLINGVPQTGDVPPVASFLESTSGAYTTTRTHDGASCILFWDRHVRRLTESVRILAETRPDLLGPGSRPASNQAQLNLSSVAKSVNHSLKIGHMLAYDERAQKGLNDELAITALVRRKGGFDGLLDVFLHIGFYAPPVFGSGGACLAVAGPGRELASVKYSDWVR